MTNPPCQLLEWDTGFFGFRIARVTGNRLSRDDAPDILDWCAAERIRCLYMLAASDDAETADTAAAYQFSFVDIRTTLRADRRRSAAAFRMRPSSDRARHPVAGGYCQSEPRRFAFLLRPGISARAL